MADRKISDLTALTTPASGDYLPIVDISEAAAASKNKRITIEELMRGVPDGTAAAPGIAFETDPNTGIYSPGADQLAVATNGTGRLFVDASGKVGVGTASPSAPLTFAASTGRKIGFYQGTEGYSIGVENSEFRFVTDAGGVFTFKNGGTYSSAAEFARIDSSGRLGIGTSSPQQELHINDATGVSRIRLTGGAVGADSFEIGQAIQGVSNTGFSIYDVEATASRLVIDSSGNVGIGSTTSAATSKLQVFSDAGGRSVFRHASGDGGVTIAGAQAASSSSLIFGNTWDTENGANFAEEYRLFFDGSTDSLAFKYNNNVAEAMRLDSSGRLLVGTSTGIVTGSSVQAALQVVDNSNLSAAFRMNRNDSSGPIIAFGKSRSTSDGGFAVLQSGDELGAIRFAGADGGDLQTQGAAISAFVDGTPGANDMPGRLVFSTTSDSASSPTERMRIDRNGLVDIGGYGNAGLSVTTPVGTPLQLNRTGNDGELVRFKQDGTTEGNITVSGTTVSYNGAHLARWSQLASGAERTETLRGSVLSNLDEMCEWSEEDNEQLNRMKVSDVEGDPNVSGVFQSWDDDDDTYTNDFYCAMTGDFIIRIAEGVTVERGDLLMSAGDGTAKPQDDDIIRSKTIAKVTSTNVSCTYADGSYCVPCVLMAC
jgi:hypothetical protein